MKKSINLPGFRIWLLVICSLCSSAFSESTTKLISIDSAARFEAIPNDLAFALLGLSGSTIEQPGTISRLLGSIQPIIGNKGGLPLGLAVSFAPYQLAMGNRLQLADYISNYGVRILSNAQVSLGTAPSLNIDSSQDFGVGIRINILNAGDGRLDKDHIKAIIVSSMQICKAYTFSDSASPAIRGLVGNLRKECVNINNIIQSLKNGEIDILPPDFEKMYDTLEVLADSLKKLDPLNSTDGIKEWIASSRRQIKEGPMIDSTLTARGASPAWNTGALDFSIGTVFRAANANITKTNDIDRLRLWLNGGIGIGSYIQALAQVGWFHQYTNLTANDSNYVTTGIMVRGGNKDFRVGLGASAKNFDNGVISAIVELRVSSLGWIVGSVDRVFVKDMKSAWNPSLSLKLTGLGL